MFVASIFILKRRIGILGHQIEFQSFVLKVKILNNLRLFSTKPTRIPIFEQTSPIC
jgi:hypothetical protein